MITEFINYIQNIKGYSGHTAIAYRKDLKQFVQFIKQNYEGARWSTITRDMIDHYIMTLVAYGELATTTNRKLAAISSLYGYFIRQGLTTENPCRYESRRKIAEQVPNTISPEQLRTAYDHAAGSVRVMLGLLITTGMRIGELLSLTWADVDVNGQTITLHGKGAKERKVSVPTEQLKEIAAVIDKQEPAEHIFHTSQFETRCMIYQALLPYCAAKQLSPHAIRHTFATELAKSGANATTIQKQLGHSKLETTQKYIDIAQVTTNGTCRIIKLH